MMTGTKALPDATKRPADEAIVKIKAAIHDLTAEDNKMSADRGDIVKDCG